ncbi:MAG: hypothetical protein KJ799_07265 [Bacteroidetes bacterium]|nr:hypothetical protein [Bacteroidota bacterium]
MVLLTVLTVYLLFGVDSFIANKNSSMAAFLLCREQFGEIAVVPIKYLAVPSLAAWH